MGSNHLPKVGAPTSPYTRIQVWPTTRLKVVSQANQGEAGGKDRASGAGGAGSAGCRERAGHSDPESNGCTMRRQTNRMGASATAEG